MKNDEHRGCAKGWSCGEAGPLGLTVREQRNPVLEKAGSPEKKITKIRKKFLTFGPKSFKKNY
ncbi:MAG: hypothetical protein MJ162_01470 [Treponema sp.]|nr:hypothetical protein [Treponema sp.]